MFGPAADSAEPLLELRDFGVAFGERVVLQGLTLQMRSPCLSIMGHAGAGKSTLLRTLAGLNDAQPELKVQGEARYLGQPIAGSHRPWLVGQKARLLLSTVHENIAQALRHRERMSPSEQRAATGELVRDALGPAAPSLDARVIELPLGVQRCLAIARGIASGADLVMVDEPTAGLPDEDRLVILDLLLRVSRSRGVLLVTHHLGDARALGGDLVLLVGGRPVEQTQAAQFFSAPQTAAGRRFLETGTCYFVDEPPPADADGAGTGKTPAEEISAGEADMAVAEVDVERAASGSLSRATPAPPPPSKYLHWVIPGRLLGMPRPGFSRDLDDDLGTLAEMGVTVVVCLEETRTVPEDALARFGMRLEHIPIEDMKAPTVEVARAACESVRAHLDEGRVVAVHCLGGAGRTGLLLASYFIFLGASALDALEAVRRVQPRFVQSEVQVDFLSFFELQCRGEGAPA
jgi:atypical dual specificity phosphatase